MAASRARGLLSLHSVIHHRLPSRRRFLALAACLSAGAIACDDDVKAEPTPTSITGSFVGTVAGTDIRVGVIASASTVIAFFCGGPQSLASSVWLKSERTGDRITLADGAKRVTVTLASGRADGTFDPGDGRALTFAADVVSEDGIAGVYEATDNLGRAAVVAFADDQLQGAFIRQGDGFVTQIVPIKVGRIELDASGAFSVQVDSRVIRVFRVRSR